MKILLAVDGSAYTKKMLAYLSTHSGFFSEDNEYTVFTVRPPLQRYVNAAIGKKVVNIYHHEEAENVISFVTKFLLRHNIDAKSSWMVGSAGKAISKFAADGKFDLVIMGSHGASGLLKLVLGSVVTEVLAICNIPVLIVR